jgi:hypothetical protein
MSATAPTMIAAAMSVRRVTDSPANAHPSSTATIGLTYAYVATLAGVDTRRSQT